MSLTQLRKGDTGSVSTRLRTSDADVVCVLLPMEGDTSQFGRDERTPYG